MALGQPIELAPYRAAIAAGNRPRHVLLDLADQTGGVAVTSHGARFSLADRLFGRLVGEPVDWWVARHILARSRQGYIHANGEAIGFALLLLHWLRPSRSVRVGFWVMSPNGRRVHLWLRLIGLLRLRPLLLAESEAKGEAIRAAVGPSARVEVLLPPMDLAFWSPGTGPEPRSRPLIVSAGLEKRDYRTLATVVDGLDVDVVVCAVSPDARTTSASLPDVMPPNMAFEDLSIEQLRDHYRRADLVVVPTVANDIDAGGSTSMEAMACGRPVVVPAQGMYLGYGDAGVLRLYPVGSVDSLRQAVNELLASPDDAAALGRAARGQAEAHHDERVWRANLIERIRRGGVAVNDISRARADATGLEPQL